MRKLFWILITCMMLALVGGCCGTDDDVYIPAHNQGGGESL